MTFDNAADVRRYLKQNGITEKMSVRRSANPFGGRDIFVVNFINARSTLRMASTVPGEPSAGFGGDLADVRRKAHAITEAIRANVSIA